MPTSLSLDLRRRILAAVRTQPQKEVAQRFGVGLATVQRLLQRERAGAPLAPKPHGGGPGRIVRPEHEAAVAEWLAENPSLTQAELAGRLTALVGRPVSRQTAQRTLGRMGYTWKKKRWHPPNDSGRM